MYLSYQFNTAFVCIDSHNSSLVSKIKPHQNFKRRFRVIVWFDKGMNREITINNKPFVLFLFEIKETKKIGPSKLQCDGALLLMN